jgi:hypothetical protein
MIVVQALDEDDEVIFETTSKTQADAELTKEFLLDNPKIKRIEFYDMAIYTKIRLLGKDTYWKELAEGEFEKMEEVRDLNELTGKMLAAVLIARKLGWDLDRFFNEITQMWRDCDEEEV